MDDELVLGAVVRLIDSARQLHPDYARLGTPMPTNYMWRLLKNAACKVEVFPFQSDAAAMAMPSVNGIHPIYINRNADVSKRQFAERHELAHVLRGDLDGILFMDGSHEAPAERIADLFALADMIPAAWLDVLTAVGADIAREVIGLIREYTEDWPSDRLEDRANLRLRLYQECRI